MGPKRTSGWKGRTDLQAALVACAAVAAMAGAALILFALLPAAAARWAVALTALLLGAGSCLAARRCFRRISNLSYRDLSNTDQLTGLKNRNAFELDLRNLHTRRDWRGTGILLVDLDNLKGVNDTLGHTAGDRYLRHAADALRRAGAGTGYRVGGDEFVLLCRADGAQLPALARRVEEEFAARRPAWPVALFLSVGWAWFDPDQDRSLYDTYHRADRHMYRQKQARRGAGPAQAAQDAP